MRTAFLRFITAVVVLIPAAAAIPATRADCLGPSPEKLFRYIPEVSAPLSDVPDRIEITNLDDDGVIDLVVLSRSASTVSLYHRYGENLSRYSSFATGPSPTRLLVVDINHDGLAEILTVNANSITLFRPLSPGYARTDFPLPGIPLNLAAGDFDQDGDEDVIVGVPTKDVGRLHLFITQPDGSINGPVTVLNQPVGAVGAGDFDGDGNMDIMTTESSETVSSPKLLFLAGRGDNTFAAPAGSSHGTMALWMPVGQTDSDPQVDAYPTGSEDPHFFFLDDDAYSDLAYLNSSNIQIRRGLNRGWPVIPATNGLSALAPYDWNGDGLVDIVTGDTNGPRLRIFLTDPSFHYGSFYARFLTCGLAAMELSDVDRNGTPDLVGLAKYECQKPQLGHPQKLITWLGNSWGGFATGHTRDMANSPALPFAVADADGDGVPDAFLINRNHVFRLRGTGNGSFSAPEDLGIPGQPNLLRAADFNGDGGVDLILRDTAPESLSLWRPDSTGYARAPLPAFPGAVTWVTVGDANADGRADLIISRVNPAGVSILHGRGDGTFAAPINVNVGVAPQRATLAFLDNNGIPEILLADSGGNMAWRLSRRDNGSYSVAGIDVGEKQFDVAAGDLNGDGGVDIAFATAGATTPVFASDCSGGFLPRISIPGSVNATIIRIADVTSDGRKDLIEFSSGIYIWRNEGTFEPSPNRILSLTAERTAAGVLVNWTVLNNGPPDSFRLLRRAGGELAAVNEAALSGESSYSILDPSISVQAAEYTLDRTTPEGFTIRGEPIVLPGIESVASFKTTRHGSEVLVEWTVAEPAVRHRFSLDRASAGEPRTEWQSGGAWTGTTTFLKLDPEASDSSLAYWLVEVGVDGVEREYGPSFPGGTPPPQRFAVSVRGANPGAGPLKLILDLPETRMTRAILLDVTGRVVGRLIDADILAGIHEITWDGRGDNGKPLPAAVYFLRITAGSETSVQRLVRLR